MLGQKRIPSREGRVEIVVEEMSTRMVALDYWVTCYNRRGHHLSGAEFESVEQKNNKRVDLKSVFTIDRKCLAKIHGLDHQ